MKTDDLPTFLRVPEKPHAAPHDLLDAIEQRELYRLWVKAGVISRAPQSRGVTWSELIGVISVISTFAFCVGYWMAS